MDIKFPKFLLIDTPENVGIDDSDLIKALSLISEIGDDDSSIEKAQIILTTGQNKYPKRYEDKVFERITKKSKLLEKRAFDLGS